jgi:hypothetical protein
MGGPPTRSRCSEGIGEGAASAARTPRSSSAVHPCIHASVQASTYVRVGLVWAVSFAFICEGVCREGKQEVRCEEGMGESDGVIAGYSWLVSVRLFCACLFLCAPLCAFVRVFFVSLCAC